MRPRESPPSWRTGRRAKAMVQVEQFSPRLLSHNHPVPSRPTSGDGVHLLPDGRVALDTPQGRRFVGRVVSQADGRKAFVSPRRKSLHLLRVADAWGEDEGLLSFLLHTGIDLIQIEEREECLIYTTTPAAFATKGFLRDFGHAPQRFLPRHFWTQQRVDQLSLLEAHP